MTKKKLIAILIAAVVVLGAVAGVIISIKKQSETSVKLSVSEAEELVNGDFDAMAVTDPLKLIAEKNYIKVNDVSYGDEKNVIFSCTVDTVDVYSAVSPHYNEFLSSDVKKPNGMFKSSLNFQMEFEDRICELVGEGAPVSCETEIVYYEIDGKLTLYAEKNIVDCVYGGAVKLSDEVLAMKTYKVTENGETVEKPIETNNVNRGFVDCIDMRYSAEKPDVSAPIVRAWNSLKADFKKNFIDHDRWLTILKGLWTTVRLTFFSLLIGIFIGFIVAFVRCTYDKLHHRGFLLKLTNAVCKVYLAVTRGTPVVVQIMIIYFVIFMPMNVDKFIAAVICFGLNSGAYVAEIVRGGIMSIDNGQTEAGRSLGFNYMQTMFHIVFPQAFKAVLPALANEFVVLLKETSIAFYIGLGDLMYAGNAIRAATYSAFMPLVTVAVIYLIMVLALSKLVSILERRLRNNER